MTTVKYPVLAPGYVFRRLESPVVYDISGDELYELDDEAFIFLKECNGKNPASNLFNDGEMTEAIEFMLDEGILLMKDRPDPRNITINRSPIPSLRYLLLNITNACNLACKHCYLGKSGNLEMDIDTFEKAVSQFEKMGGLKLMISGGEPFLHSRFREFMEILPSYELRVVVLSNGTLVDESAARKLSLYVDEVQVSIDGIGSHDHLRGMGSYKRSMDGISNLVRAGIPVSIATMIHKFNTGEFVEMEKLFSALDVISWSVDVPTITGALAENQEFVLDIDEAAQYLDYGFGSGAHESTGDHTCGSHMCSVSPDGSVNKCGFFDDRPVGDVKDLRLAWEELCRKYLFTLDELDCRDCPKIQNCRGGCRFRAERYRGIYGPDPVMCHANGILRYL